MRASRWRTKTERCSWCSTAKSTTSGSCAIVSSREAIDSDRAATRKPSFNCTRTRDRSEEHTSELQSRVDLVCRLLLEKKNKETQERRQSHKEHDRAGRRDKRSKLQKGRSRR